MLTISLPDATAFFVEGITSSGGCAQLKVYFPGFPITTHASCTPTTSKVVLRLVHVLLALVYIEIHFMMVPQKYVVVHRALLQMSLTAQLILILGGLSSIPSSLTDSLLKLCSHVTNRARIVRRERNHLALTSKGL